MQRPEDDAVMAVYSAASAASGTSTAAFADVASVTAANDDMVAKCCDGFDNDCDKFGQDLAVPLEDTTKFRFLRGSDSCARRRASVATRDQVQQEGP
ncbi:hypothetical protein CLOM_g6967 [Closterium sp. NIES-68]|nr:hypothetical protein CLOM_g6967 [Closterium sp. NIES-68]GJP68684.1 hypothetical protein CLOP_g25345 [Closterium sp. NIES-67]GJP83282.1 hypothetical protein CLOP_g13456 [Closterium sp. NIES-67]